MTQDEWQEALEMQLDAHPGADLIITNEDDIEQLEIRACEFDPTQDIIRLILGRAE